MAASKGRVSNETLLRSILDMRVQIGELRGLLHAALSRQTQMLGYAPPRPLPQMDVGAAELLGRKEEGMPPQLDPPEVLELRKVAKQKQAARVKLALEQALQQRENMGIPDGGNAVTPEDARKWEQEEF